MFQLLGGKYPEVDTVIMTGGRLSGKSYATSVWSSEAALQYDYDILYSRFTNLSIEDSIKKEFVDKLESRQLTPYFELQQNKVKSLAGTGAISFKGIKTGMKGQTANLKSLVGFNAFIVDEAEEIPDKNTFKKVFYSIRSIEKRNLSILLLNPATKEHWIYKEYFEKMEVVAGFNGIKDNVMYIHTSYLDLDQKAIPENILRDYERLLNTDPLEYEQIILGGWVENVQGTLFPQNELNWFKLSEFELPEDYSNIPKIAYIDVATGGMDYLCLVYAIILNQKVYILDVIMDKRDTNFTLPACKNLLHTKRPHYCVVETNAAGGIFMEELKKGIQHTNVTGLHNSTNKETRIINNAYFIKNHVVFRSDYEMGDEYHQFVKQIMAYNKDKKLNTHDDAPDALSGLATLAQENYGRFIY